MERTRATVRVLMGRKGIRASPTLIDRRLTDSLAKSGLAIMLWIPPDGVREAHSSRRQAASIGPHDAHTIHRIVDGGLWCWLALWNGETSYLFFLIRAFTMVSSGEARRNLWCCCCDYCLLLLSYSLGKAQAGVEITPSFFSYLYFGSEADSSYCGTRKVSSVQCIVF